MTAFDPVRSVDEGFVERVRALVAKGAPKSAGERVHERTTLTRGELLELFEAQATSRHVDFAARALRKTGASFYTIGSAGHEGNAAVAAALRTTDPALLHYRSGAFFVARARAAGRAAPELDMLLGICAARDEPIAGGRHKVIGSLELAIPPQTSTIASHLPRALGLAFALDRARHLGLRTPYPDDAIVVASFGDASASHSTAVGALNAACQTVYGGFPVPLLFVCEDNGLGISVPTPRGWVRAAWSERPGLRYFHADGADPVAVWEATRAAALHVRERRRPAFLHLDVVRLLGHAGSDAEIAYRTAAQIREAEARDPMVGTARVACEHGVATPDELLALYESVRARVADAAARAARSEKLRDASDVMAPIAPSRPEIVAQEARRRGSAEVRARIAGERLPEGRGGLTLAESINAALADLLAARPELVVFGEDVGKKGGVYGLTRGLAKRAGVARVFDTLLDEQSVLGLALGAGLAGLLPVPEIQYLAYLHNAIDQIRGEAATLSFFSNGQYRNPLVVRIAAYGYQKGFGGHFHNDDFVAALSDIPGVVVASPARPDDAAAMLHTCVAAAAADGRVSLYLEPIALYHERDLHEEGDGGWLAPYPTDAEHVPIGSARVHGDGRDVLLVSFANGVRMSLRAARRLSSEGIRARVLDLRWLAPLPVDDLLREARAVGRVLVVDETRRQGGVSESVIAALVDGGFGGPIRRVTSLDSFVPLGPAADHVLLGESAVETAARELTRVIC